MQLQEFRSSLARGGLLPDNRGMSPITPSSAFGEWQSPFARTSLAGPLSAGLASDTRSTSSGSLPFSPGPSSAPSGLPWPKESRAPDQQSRSVSSSRTSSSAYVNTSGHVIPVLNVVEPDRENIRSTSLCIPTIPEKEDETTTPTISIASPRTAEFAMTPLHPSPEVDSADAFGLMSPTATEFTSSPFDRPSLLAQLGMGSMRQQENLPARTRSLRSSVSPHMSIQPGGLITPSQSRRLRAKISSPSIREQQQLQRLQADIETKLHIQQHQHVPTSRTADTFPNMSDALMSPRATEFTQNPFASMSPVSTEPAAATAAEPQRNTVAADPRSPAQSGIAPITRNLEDFL
jgi:tyrosine-protein phosphatase